MIQNFSDHAANERTFLAWVRTAVVIMAFGFLVEKFDLFLQFASQTMPNPRLRLHETGFGRIAGFVLILMGTAIVLVALGRFVAIGRAIDKKEMLPGYGSRVDIALAGMLALLGAALLFYLSNGLITGQ
jgi:putative membrane protein